MKTKALKYVKLLDELQETISVRDANLKYCSVVGPMECYLLLYLSEELRQVNMNELAKLLNVSYSRVTRIIDGLVKKGLVTRLNCKEDRRKWFVVLTASGRSLIKKTSKRILDNQLETLSYLPSDQVDEILDALVVYKKALEFSTRGFEKRVRRR